MTGPDEQPASERLRAFITHLTRQKWRQLSFDYGLVGLFWGLAVSAFTMLTLKLLMVEQPTLIPVVLIIGGALVAAAAKTWVARPDELQVAIHADIKLKLKQRLSTAWEFAQADANSDISQRLAVQAVKLRFPPPTQPIFAFRLTTYGRLVPIAALALVLVSMLDLHRLLGSSVPIIDDVVISEGVRLREFARLMQVRAQREVLPRSQQEAENVRRLGSRMQSGSLSRQEAVSRLQGLGEALARQHRAALSDGGTQPGVPESFAVSGSGDTDTSRLKDLLEQLLQGNLTAGDIAALSQESESLSRLGISAQDLSHALENYTAGDPLDVQQMLDDLERLELAMSDAAQLGRAIEQVDGVRENLGDIIVSAEDLMQPGTGSDRDDLDNQTLAYSISRDAGEEAASLMSLRGFGAGSGVTPRDRPQTLDPNSERNDVVLKPQSVFGDGAGFTTQTRVLPRAGQATVANLELDVRFDAQMEEVLAKEQYPLHQKEFIRRYFLSLSQGVARDPQADEEQQ